MSGKTSTVRTRFNPTDIAIVLAVVALLSAMAMPAWSLVVDQQRNQLAANQLQLIRDRILQQRTLKGSLPVSLQELRGLPDADPWGHPYVYRNLRRTQSNVARRDHRLHAINRDFDLYSKGSNGDSRAPLNAMASRDDIVMAGDGSYVGSAADYR
jgi:general secretion pathway protein G